MENKIQKYIIITPSGLRLTFRHESDGLYYTLNPKTMLCFAFNANGLLLFYMALQGYAASEIQIELNRIGLKIEPFCAIVEFIDFLYREEFLDG